MPSRGARARKSEYATRTEDSAPLGEQSLWRLTEKDECAHHESDGYDQSD
jgi:hypothetical protein